jgi:hypothetical protein
MWVASGVSITRTTSSSTRAGSTSSNRRARAEEHGDLMDLQLVEHAGLERPLRRIPAEHNDVALAGGGLRLRHRALDPVGDVGDERVVRDRRAGRPVAGDEDRDAVLVTAPVVDLLDGPPAGDDRAGRQGLGDELLGGSGLRVQRPVLAVAVPLVQSHEAVAAGVARVVTRPGDVAVDRHRHVEH